MVAELQHSGGFPVSRGGWGGRTQTRGTPPRQPLGPQAAEPPKPSRMEVLDEFDSEFPQTVTFCQLISEEDFETQAATYTERALRRLFRSLDRNPALAERVVRKGKQAECERRGLLSFLWVRPVGRGRGGPGWGAAGGAGVPTPAPAWAAWWGLPRGRGSGIWLPHPCLACGPRRPRRRVRSRGS